MFLRNAHGAYVHVGTWYFGIETLEDRIQLTPEQVMHFLELCHQTTHFSFRGEFIPTDGQSCLRVPCVLHGS